MRGRKVGLCYTRSSWSVRCRIVDCICYQLCYDVIACLFVSLRNLHFCICQVNYGTGGSAEIKCGQYGHPREGAKAVWANEYVEQEEPETFLQHLGYNGVWWGPGNLIHFPHYFLNLPSTTRHAQLLQGRVSPVAWASTFFTILYLYLLP